MPFTSRILEKKGMVIGQSRNLDASLFQKVVYI